MNAVETKALSDALVAKGVDPALLAKIISELGANAGPVLADIAAIMGGTGTWLTPIDLWNRLAPLGADVITALFSLFARTHAGALAALHQ